MQVLRTVVCVVWRWFCVQSLPQVPKETERDALTDCFLHSFHSVFQNFRNCVFALHRFIWNVSLFKFFYFWGFVVVVLRQCLPYSLPLYIPASISQVVELQACAVVIPSFNLFLSFLSYFIICISIFKIT